MGSNFQIMHTIPSSFVIFCINSGVMLHIAYITVQLQQIRHYVRSHFHSYNPFHSWFGQWYGHLYKLQYPTTMRAHETSCPHNESIPWWVCRVVHQPLMLDEPTRQKSTFKWHLLTKILKSASLVGSLMQGIAKTSPLFKDWPPKWYLFNFTFWAHIKNNITLFLLGR